MDEVLTLFADLAERLLDDVEDRAAATRLLAVATGGGDSGIAALLSLARLVGEAAEAQPLADALALAVADGAVARLALFVALCFGAVRFDYATRQDAVAARSRVADAADALYPLLSQAGPAAVDFAVRLSGQVVVSLSAVAASRTPLVRVEINVSTPSALMAWQMYADPARAGDLVRRNHVATPMLMPAVFEATAD